MRQFERWARKNKKSEALDFLSGLQREVVFSRPTLLGSINGHDRFVEGFCSTTRVIREFFTLDDEYNPIEGLPSLTLVLRKRNDPDMSSKIMRSVQIGMGVRTPKICLAQHLGDCNKPIVAAHTIPLHELKRFVNIRNHVYGVVMNGKIDKRGFMIPQEIGMRVATTFTGICNRHDTKLFYPIENEDFTGSNQQLFLFHYRALLFQYYRVNFYVQKLQRAYDEMNGAGYEKDIKSIANILRNNELDRNEINSLKIDCDKKLLASDYDSLYLRSWVSDKPPPLVGTVVFGPHKNLFGKRIQKPSSGKPLEWVSLTITIKRGRTLVVVGANSKSEISKSLVESIEAIPNPDRMQALICYTICIMENAIYLPWWWENLDSVQQEAVISCYFARVFPRKMPSLGEWNLEPFEP